MAHTNRNLLRYVGDINQLCGAREYELTSGKGRGMRAIDVKNGSGLDFTILPDRGFDIGSLTFRGLNCGYLSKTGLVAPGYWGNGAPEAFLRGFYGGFLTTCGLRNVGNACRENGESHGQHGRISHIPADEVCVSTDWPDGMPVITLRGKVRESALFGENLTLEREIVCRYGEDSIHIRNRIKNSGFRPETLMFLLHFNIGYPLLDDCARFLAPSEAIVPRDEAANKGLSEHSRMQEPTPDYAEQVFYHDMRADNEKNTCVALVNPSLELAVTLDFNKTQFSNFAQWKQMGQGDYVLGMEPCNCYVGGRTDPLNKATATILQPGETKCFDVTVSLHSGAQQIGELKEKINRLTS